MPLPILPYETPSRVWRRIEEAQAEELPSLPSLPEFEDQSFPYEGNQNNNYTADGTDDGDVRSVSTSSNTSQDAPTQSTPQAVSNNGRSRTMSNGLPSSASSTVRFANSILTSRSAGTSIAKTVTEESFEVSGILPRADSSGGEDMDLDVASRDSIPAVHVDPSEAQEDEDGERSISLTEALPSPIREGSPTKELDYEESVLSDSNKPSPLDPLRRSFYVNTRRPMAPKRVPALSRSPSSSSSSSPPNSTPSPSFHNLPLPSPERPVLRTQEHETEYEEEDEDQDNDAATEVPARTPSPYGAIPATPAQRNHSFLLSLVNSTTRPRLAAPTPHPLHSRRPHPLSQATPAPRAASTPSSGSRFEASSFISTASSHDLTTHARANASFDPLTDRPNKFSHQKLNTYLYGLNKRLVEENRHLVEAVNREHPESFGDQLVSALEEKAAEDDKVKEQLRDALKKSEEKCAHLIEDLEAEKEARRRGAEKFKMQIESASREVESLVEDLDHKLASKEEEIKVLKERLGQDGREADRVKDAEERAEKAREAREVAERKAVGMERDLERCKSDLDRRAREVSALERKSEELASALRDEKATTTALSNQLQDSSSRLSEMESRALSAESGLEELASELSSKQASLVSANVRISTLEAELKRNETDIEERQKLEAALDECERKLVTDDEDIRSLRKKTEALEEEVQSARRQTHRQPHPSELESDTSSMDTAPEEMMRVEEHERIITDLEAQLDEAHRDIGRLEHQLAGSPASKALAQAKDVRIELLEKERQELMERVDALRGALGAGDADGTLKPSTPGAGAASSTPARPLHKAVLSLRTPKTPGAPLKDLSWLARNSVANSSAVSSGPLVAQIEVLQAELADANESLDEKIDRLEHLGLGTVQLTQKLTEARTRIGELERELERYKKREERLVRCKCVWCGKRFDASKVIRGEGSSAIEQDGLNSSQSAEALRAALAAANAQLSSLKLRWEDDVRKLQGGKAVLQDKANQLNAKVERERDGPNGEEARVHAELEKVQATVSTLEDDLKKERSRLRALSVEQTRINREKGNIEMQLERTRLDLEDVKNQLQKAKKENHDLEAELRSNTTVDQKARLLESKVAESQEAIDHLRHERETLLQDHEELQKQFAEVTERMESLRRELASAQIVHDNRRHQLDLQVTEVDDLKQALDERVAELRNAASTNDKLSSERDRLRTEKDRLNSERAQLISVLEADMKRVRKDAERFAKDLQDLRVERDALNARRREDKEQAERTNSQAQAQIKTLTEQLESIRRKAGVAERNLTDHVCSSDSDNLTKLQLQHNQESKGLMLRIKYLKAKCTRESELRMSVGYQKIYLLRIISALKSEEKKILACIARVGFPLPVQRRKKPSLRTVAVTILFLVRAKRASDEWRKHRQSQSEMAAAHDEARRRRRVTST